MVRLVRATTDRNPPTLGGGGCQAYISEELVPKLLNRNNNMMNGALQKVEALQKELDAIQELAACAAGKLHQVDEEAQPG